MHSQAVPSVGSFSDLVHQIRANDNTLHNIACDKCPELERIINRLRQHKERELIELNAERQRELSKSRQRHSKQTLEVHRQQRSEVADFREYCTAELGRMKREIEESAQSRDSIDLAQIFDEYADIRCKSGSAGSVRVNTRNQRAKWNATLQQSLDANAVASDLNELMKEAKKQHIELDAKEWGPMLRQHSKKKKKRRRKATPQSETEELQTPIVKLSPKTRVVKISPKQNKKQGVASVPSAEDRKEIERICDECVSGASVRLCESPARVSGYPRMGHHKERRAAD